MKLTDRLFHRGSSKRSAGVIRTSRRSTGSSTIGAAQARRPRFARDPRCDRECQKPHGDNPCRYVAGQIAGSVGLRLGQYRRARGPMFRGESTAPRPRRCRPRISPTPLGLPDGRGDDGSAHNRQGEVASAVEKCLASRPRGWHPTYDIFNPAHLAGKRSARSAFARRPIIARLGQPQTLGAGAPRRAKRASRARLHSRPRRVPPARELVGAVEVFVAVGPWPPTCSPGSFRRQARTALELTMITNRGVKVLARGPARDLLHRPLALPVRWRSPAAAEQDDDRDLQCGSRAWAVDFVKTRAPLPTFTRTPAFRLARGQ